MISLQLHWLQCLPAPLEPAFRTAQQQSCNLSGLGCRSFPKPEWRLQRPQPMPLTCPCR